jgi:hypothetical protein
MPNQVPLNYVLRLYIASDHCINSYLNTLCGTKQHNITCIIDIELSKIK